jgi:hypothetical protein
MAVGPKDSTQRYVSGHEQPISCTILDNVHPDVEKGTGGGGWILVYPEHFTEAKVSDTQGVWAWPESSEQCTAGFGRIRHNVLAGTKGRLHYDQSGTARVVLDCSESGGDAAVGMPDVKKGVPGYPPLLPEGGYK